MMTSCALLARKRFAFTLVELLTVIGIIALLAAILFPIFAQAREKARQANCESNLRQIGLAFAQYSQDNDGRFPDRRDLKQSLPGGYHPWDTAQWPPSDPRGGWATSVMSSYIPHSDDPGGVWSCPSVAGKFEGVSQVEQWTPQGTSRYWLWRFDQIAEPIPQDDAWGKTEDELVRDLVAANNPQAGQPNGVADVELAVDPYFPRTIPSVPANLKGKAVHMGGRNRLFLDGHVRWFRDTRTE